MMCMCVVCDRLCMEGMGACAYMWSISCMFVEDSGSPVCGTASGVQYIQRYTVEDMSVLFGRWHAWAGWKCGFEGLRDLGGNPH